MIQGFDDKYLQSFEYDTTIISDSNIVGTCELGKATIQMINDSNEYSSLKGQWIKTIHGSFYIQDVEPVQEKVNIKLSCYDVKYKLDTKYNSSLYSFPMTLKEWRNQIGGNCGIQFDDSEFPNSDLILNFEPYIGENPSNRNVISLIAQAGCSFVTTDENDIFYFKWFEDTTYVVDDWLELTTEKEFSSAINTVVLGRGDVEDNVYYPEKLPENPTEFRIDNNYILDPQNLQSDKRYDVIQPIYNQVNGFSYLIFNIRSQNISNKLDIKLGQKVSYIDIWGNNIETCIMSKTINWLGGDVTNPDNYEITLSSEEIKETSTQYSYASSVERQLLEVQRTADKLNGEITDISKKIVDISSTINNVGSIELTNASETALYKLIIKNACQIFPNQKLYPDENLYPKNSNLIIEYSDSTQKIIELPSLDLLNYEGVNDDLTIENGIATKTKKIGIDTNGDMYLLETPVVVNLGKIDIPLKEGTNKIYLQSFEYASLEATYLLKNDYTNVFANQAQVSSQLNITTDQILLESKSYTDTATDGDALISKINLDSTGNIKIEASKTIDMTGTDINLTGDNVTISSNNFSVDSEGNIKSTSGEIGGYTIGETELYSKHIGTYEFKQSDLDKMRNYFMGTGSLTEEEMKLYDVNQDGKVNSIDYARIKSAIDNGNPTMDGTVELSSQNMYSMLRINDNFGNNAVDIGIDGIRTTGSINTKSISCSSKITTTGLESENGDIIVGINSSGNPLIRLSSTSGTVHCVSVNQTSLLENKKNIEKFENASNILSDIDIYKYNFNLENDNHKKHLGFIIGENYRYSSEITAIDENGKEIGVDLYSMTSLCLQILKEQQKEINTLKKEIEVLKYEK